MPAGGKGIKKSKRIINLDLSAPEWDWLSVQAATVGISFHQAVRDALRVAAPVASDPAFLATKRQALAEARVAVFGLLRQITVDVMRRFLENPEAFVPANMRPHPELLASLPAWHEPGNENLAPYDPYTKPDSGVMP